MESNVNLVNLVNLLSTSLGSSFLLQSRQSKTAEDGRRGTLEDAEEPFRKGLQDFYEAILNTTC